MKIINVKETNDIEKLEKLYSKYHSLDWKECSEESLAEFDASLKEFDLEVEFLNDDSDTYWFRVIKRTKKA